VFELSNIRYRLPDSIERVVVFSPHPDDETLGCGGTIALYAEKITFTVVALSNGEAVNIEERNKAELWQRELKEAMKLLSVRDIVFLNIPDEKFQQYRKEMKQKLSEIYRDKTPDMVFAPSPFDIHPDHEATAQACIELGEQFPSVKIAFYEVYNPGRFNTLIDIGSVVELKRKALRKYHYSMLKKDDIFISSALSLNRARSVFPLRDSWYEAFWITENPGEGIPLFPEDRLLTALRSADTLIHNIRSIEGEVAVKEEELQNRESQIQDLTRQISTSGKAPDELTQKLALIEESLFWRIAGKFYRFRDSLFPQGTKVRTLYNRIVSVIKRTYS
jgi:LmbE family N-acetylglucosaminyl deacetylase